MNRRSLLMAVAAGLLACSFGAMNATAGTILASEDEGTFDYVLKADGAGNITITYTGVFLTKINGTAVGPILSQLHGTGGSEMVSVTSTVTTGALTEYTFSDANPGTKSFGIGTDAIDTAALQYKVVNGSAVNPGFLNLNASIIAVPSPLLETTGTSPTIYDFSPFAAGGSMTLTYNKVGANFAAVIASGGMVSGTGAFTELAVPEPASLALLGIGMTGFLAFRRFMKKASAA